MPLGPINAIVAYMDFINEASIFTSISLWYSSLVDILIHSKVRHEYTTY